MRINKFYIILAVLGAFLVLLMLWPAESDHHGEEEADPDAYGHAADGHYLDLSPFAKVELPRILLFRDAEGGLHLDFYRSTKKALLDTERPYLLRDAEDNILTQAQVYALVAEDEEHFLQIAGEEAASDLEDVQGIIGLTSPYYFPLAIPPGEGAIVVDFSITRQLFATFVAAILLLVIGLWLGARYRRGIGREEAPRGIFQNMMEVVFVFIRDEIAKPAIGDPYRKYVPFLATVFLFILIANLLGLVPWGVTATSNIMVTGTLALFTLAVVIFSGTKEYWKHMFNPPGIPSWVKPILVPVEVIGLFTKHFVLAFRLFGNMLSGHLVIVSILGMIFIFTALWGAGAGAFTAVAVSGPITLFIFLLKILISFIQAYVFTILSAIFIGLALEEHDHHEETHERIVDQTGEYVSGDGVARDVDETEHEQPRVAEMPAG